MVRREVKFEEEKPSRISLDFEIEEHHFTLEVIVQSSTSQRIGSRSIGSQVTPSGDSYTLGTGDSYTLGTG